MIVCPNCNHLNPDGAIQCEACYTPLPAMATCPSCGANVQADASFCGQCGFDLRVATAQESAAPGASASVNPVFETPLAQSPPDPAAASDPGLGADLANSYAAHPVAADPAEAGSPAPVGASSDDPAASHVTRLQVSQAHLLHVQTNTPIDLPQQLPVIRIGKPNDRIPPDVDVSGFPSSEIVSRVHASIRVEGDVYYIEDVGSSNGTYINNMPLPYGNRHRLRPGDRIALGKGDKVTFIFQST